jgi:hypothetical protein
VPDHARRHERLDARGLGDVLVTSHSGTVKVGAHNVINGTLMAANIFLGTGRSSTVPPTSSPGRASAPTSIRARLSNSILTRVRLNAPFGTIQPQYGLALRDCSHIVAKPLQLAPMTASCAGPIESSSPPNTHFSDDVPRTCVPD